VTRAISGSHDHSATTEDTLPVTPNGRPVGADR
jgi:hypothetical protein